MCVGGNRATREDTIFATLELLGSDEMVFSAKTVFDRWSAVFVFHARIGSRIEALVCVVMCFVGSLGLVVKDER